MIQVQLPFQSWESLLLCWWHMPSSLWLWVFLQHERAKEHSTQNNANLNNVIRDSFISHSLRFLVALRNGEFNYVNLIEFGCIGTLPFPSGICHFDKKWFATLVDNVSNLVCLSSILVMHSCCSSMHSMQVLPTLLLLTLCALAHTLTSAGRTLTHCALLPTH